MPAFEVQRHTRIPATEAWERMTDWERHGDFIPLTTVVVSPGPADMPRPGQRFIARTSFGPFHFDDPMDVTHWQPPSGASAGVCRIAKRGKVVTGWAVLTVTPTATGCTVAWKEDAAVRWSGALAAWPTRVIAARVFGRLVDGLLGP